MRFSQTHTTRFINISLCRYCLHHSFHTIMMFPKSMDDDPVALSYYDCLLRESDVELLNGPYWLNDNIIGFYFDYLERSMKSSLRVKFASPELTQLLKMVEPAEYPVIVDSEFTENTDILFMPFNDCERRGKAGGSHWSLLVYSKKEDACFHFDSSASSNGLSAERFADKLVKHLFKSTSAKYYEVECPQQNNSYDCGIFVLCIAERIMEHLASSAHVVTCVLKVVPDLVHNARLKILCIIRSLSEKKRINYRLYNV